MATSPLLRLPAELRIAIYDFALLKAGGIKLGFIEDPRKRSKGLASNLAVRYFEPLHLSPNLLTTCREVHQEALPIFLANHVSIAVDDTVADWPELAARDLAAWATAYGSDGHLIKSLQINYTCDHFQDITAFGTLAKKLLQLLEPVGLRPSLTITYDIFLCDDDWDFWHLQAPEEVKAVQLDVVKRSASENRDTIRQAMEDAQNYVKSEYGLFHCFNDAGEEALRMIDDVQGREESA